MVAELYRHPFSASRLNDNVQPGEYRWPRPRGDACFERFELVGYFSGRATKYPGESTDTALPTWRPVQFICPYSCFLRVRGHFRRRNKPGGSATVALRADVWFAAILSSRVANSAGKMAMRKAGKRRLPRLGLRASVCSTCSATSAGDRRCRPLSTLRSDLLRRRCRRSALLNLFADVTLVRPRGRVPRGNNRGESAETATSLNYFASIGSGFARVKTATGYATEAALPKRHLVGLFRACLWYPPGGSIPPNK